MLQYFNVILLSAAAGCGLGYLSFCTLPADYQSTARIVIVGPGGNPVAEARRELLATATLERARENSLVLALRWPRGGAISLEQVQQSLSFDEGDEPSDVIVMHCHAPSAALPQAILSSVVDAYFVRCSQQNQVSSAETEQLLEQSRKYIRDMQTQSKSEARLRSLVDSLGRPGVDPAALEQLSQQRSALLLRRNRLQQQLTQLQRGQGAVPIEVGNRTSRPGPASGPSLPAAAAATAIAPGAGAQERVAQLLEADRTLALRLGPDHPKRKAIRLEISLLGRYPVEQAQLLAEQWALLQQFGPDHPRVKQIQQRLDELGVGPLAKSGVASVDEPAAAAARSEAPGSGSNSLAGSSETGSAAQLKALAAALQNIDDQDREITQKVEAASQAREVASELRQVLESLPAEGNLQTVTAALARLAQLNSAQSALRPYLAMRPALGVRSRAGLDRKLLSGAVAGAAVGIVLSLVMLWARGAKHSAA